MTIKTASRPSGPSLITALLEIRAIFEMAATAAWQPLLKRSQQGDGHPVLVVPAFMTSDGGTSFLRRFLRSQGYTAYGWRQGRNSGIRQSLMDGLITRVEDLHRGHEKKVSIIGWSLGGVYARALANQRPDLVRQVITLGSPFNVPEMDGEKISGAVLKLYELLNPGGATDPMLDLEHTWRLTPAVPSTAIFSEGDGIASWQYCIDPPAPHTENLRVPGSHLGLTHNAVVLHALLDRLQHDEHSWQPFDLRWWRRPFYGRAREDQERPALMASH